MARTDGLFEIRQTGYVSPIDGASIWLRGTDNYINFGLTPGASGYGFRDNAGVMEFKDAGGTWAAFGTGGGGGGMAIGGAITSATAGSVLFVGAAGILQQDNANFFWDDTNNRLGINIASTPLAALHVYQPTATDDVAYFSGNGTTSRTLVSAGAGVTGAGWSATIADLTSGTLVVNNYAGSASLTVDLGSNYLVTETEIYWEPYAVSSFQIYTSTDNVTYTKVGGGTQPDSFTGYQTTIVMGSLARYVKWSFAAGSSGYTAFVGQLRVYTGVTTNSNILVSKNGLLGINNANPTRELDVNGGINARIYYENGQPGLLSQWATTGNDIYYTRGRVGAGTVAPIAMLSAGDYLGLHSQSIRGKIFTPGNAYGLDITAFYGGGDITFNMDTTRVMTILQTGVGVGIALPISKLHAASTGASEIALIAQGTASRTAPVLQLRNSAAASLGNVGGTIFNNFTDTSTTSTNGTEDDLYSYTTVADTFAINGDSISQREHVQFVSSATAARRLKKYFAGTLIFDSGALTLTLGGDFVLETTIIRESSTIVRCSVNVVTTSASSVPYATYTRITGLTLTGTNILKTTGIASGTGAASGDIVNKLSKVMLEAAA